MLNLFKKKKTEPAIRDVLFGDMPQNEWLKNVSTENEKPWSSFIEARALVESGRKQEAIAIYKKILEQPDLESRHYLQAWHFLRSLGVDPATETAKKLYGVIVEVGVNGGLDIVAAYSDLSARYFNYSGAAVVWSRPDDSLENEIKALLHVGGIVVRQIGPWDEPRPPAPAEGDVRINMLTPSGLHFGQASMEALSADQLGGPVISMAIQLMQGLIAKTEEH